MRSNINLRTRDSKVLEAEKQVLAILPAIPFSWVMANTKNFIGSKRWTKKFPLFLSFGLKEEKI